jgi:hypothetical protein
MMFHVKLVACPIDDNPPTRRDPQLGEAAAVRYELAQLLMSAHSSGIGYAAQRHVTASTGANEVPNAPAMFHVKRQATNANFAPPLPHHITGSKPPRACAPPAIALRKADAPSGSAEDG